MKNDDNSLEIDNNIINLNYDNLVSEREESIYFNKFFRK